MLFPLPLFDLRGVPMPRARKKMAGMHMRWWRDTHLSTLRQVVSAALFWAVAWERLSLPIRSVAHEEPDTED